MGAGGRLLEFLGPSSPIANMREYALSKPRGRRATGQNTERTTHSPAVPTKDITSAPPSAQPKLSIFK